MNLLMAMALAVGAVTGQTITVNPAVEYQTMTGWEATCYAGQESPGFPNFKDTVLDLVVDEVGINRVRLEVRSGSENDADNWTLYQTGVIDYDTWRSLRYSTINDNGDPDVLDPSGYYFSELDFTVEEIVLPMKLLVEGNGEALFINLNYVAFTSQIGSGLQYHHDDPDEYAEFILATFLHLDSAYGLVPDAVEVILEPDNVSQWNGTVIGQAIVATATKLSANGYTPWFIAPSNTNMANAITYFDQMIAVSGVLSYLDEFSYHRYGGVSLANLQAIAARAATHSLDTSMLEQWWLPVPYETLHEDVEVGMNSAWQGKVISGHFDIDNADPDNPTVQINSATKFLRQYYRYVRAGAVRIEATSDTGTLAPLAFINADGKYVVVVKASAGASFSIDDLPADTYGIRYTTSSEYDVGLAHQTIGAAEAVTTSIPQEGVLTVYQCAGDSDADGLYDGDELYVYDTDPFDTDSDGDRLEDGDEVAGTFGYVTDPDDEDSDGDHLNDGTEITAGTNPNDRLSYPRSDEVWINFAYTTDFELGTFSQPFNSLTEGIVSVNASGTVRIKGDTGVTSTDETPRITKPMRIEAVGGTVTIGTV
jgi:hypothetical protein